MDSLEDPVGLCGDDRIGFQDLLGGGVHPFIPQSSEGERTAILQLYVVGEGATFVVAPFKEAISEDETALGGNETSERGFFVNGLCSGIKGADTELGTGGFVLHPMRDQPPGEEVDSCRFLVRDDWQSGFSEARHMVNPREWCSRIESSIKSTLQSFEIGNRVVITQLINPSLYSNFNNIL